MLMEIEKIFANVPDALRDVLDRRIDTGRYFFEKRSIDSSIRIGDEISHLGFTILENCISPDELAGLARVFHSSLRVSYEYLKRQFRKHSSEFSEAVLIKDSGKVIGGFTVRYKEFDGADVYRHSGRDIGEVHRDGKLLIARFGPAAVDERYRNGSVGAIAGMLLYFLRPVDCYTTDTKRNGVVRGMRAAANLMGFDFFPSGSEAAPEWVWKDIQREMGEESASVDRNTLVMKGCYLSGDGDIGDGHDAQICYAARQGLSSILDR
jgi:hypothetical protein